MAAADLAALRTRIAALGLGPSTVQPLVLSALGLRLPRAGLHEVEGDAGAAAGFCAAFAGCAAGLQGRVLWCRPRRRRHDELSGDGLAATGLDPSRLLIAQPGHPRDMLWSLEEGLRAGAFAAVIGELDLLPMIASRRLQLAAEAHGAVALLLLPRRKSLPPSAALARWRIAAAPGLRWRVELARCRGGHSGFWLVEGDHETRGFTLVALPGDGSDGADQSALEKPSARDDRGAGTQALYQRG